MLRVGIDLGGTKTEIATIDASGRELLRRRVATPKENYDQIVTTIADLVARADEEVGRARTVGVATPGAVSPATGLVKNANTECLIGRQLQQDLHAALQRPVRICNDANCLVLSEATDGAAAGMDVVFGVIIGTGTGGGLVVRKRVLSGHNAVAGEWGHNPLPWPTHDESPGPPCYCGKTGCIETYLSGPGLSADHEAMHGVSLRAAEIAALSDQGCPCARATMDRYVNRMARGLASVINLLDPDVIVLGGGLSNIRRLYDDVPREWARFVFSDTVTTPLARAQHGDSSGVRGAAALWSPPEAAKLG